MRGIENQESGPENQESTPISSSRKLSLIVIPAQAGIHKIENRIQMIESRDFLFLILSSGFPILFSLTLHILALMWFLQERSAGFNTPLLSTIEVVLIRPAPLVQEVKKPVPRKVAKTISTPHKPQVESKSTPVVQPARPAAPALTTPPRYQAGSHNNPLPTYPYVSRRHGEEGKVICQIKVNAAGQAENINVTESSGFARLDDAAQKTLSTWIFQPAQKEGQKISGIIEVSITFLLEKGVRI